MKLRRFSIVFICVLCGFLLLAYGIRYIIQTQQYKSFSDTFKQELTNISKISILDGNTGQIYDINDIESIRVIIDAFKQAQYKKIISRESPVGYRYSIDFFSEDGTEAFHLILTSRTVSISKVRYYINTDFSQLLDYIEDLIDNRTS